MDIEGSDITKYQKARLAQGAANRTVNIEVAMLRQVMRKGGAWERLQADVSMLPERQDVGRALSTEEETRLLLECRRSRSRILLPFVVMALETGARFNTIRTLQWGNIDLANRCLKFGKDKTAAGTGRTVPLNKRQWRCLPSGPRSSRSDRQNTTCFPRREWGLPETGSTRRCTTPTDEPSWIN